MKILSTEVLTGISDGWAFLCILLFFVGIAGALVLISGILDGDTVTMCVGTMLLLCMPLAFTLDAAHDYEYEQHKVLISDFNEVHQDGYEIVDQEGEIYTIQLKGADEQ